MTDLIIPGTTLAAPFIAGVSFTAGAFTVLAAAGTAQHRPDERDVLRAMAGPDPELDAILGVRHRGAVSAIWRPRGAAGWALAAPLIASGFVIVFTLALAGLAPPP